MQAVADDKPAVVVHEPHHVQPPVLALQDEREQVRLPQLVGRARSKERTLSGCGRVADSSSS